MNFSKSRCFVFVFFIFKKRFSAFFFNEPSQGSASIIPNKSFTNVFGQISIKHFFVCMQEILLFFFIPKTTKAAAATTDNNRGSRQARNNDLGTKMNAQCIQGTHSRRVREQRYNVTFLKLFSVFRKH